MSKTFSIKAVLLSTLFVATTAFVGLPTKAQAAISNSASEAKISFTFDDGPASNITASAPTLAKYGYTGTGYITPRCVGMVTVPNRCPADENIPYMTWAEIKALQNTYGWEIGSHGLSHQLMTEINARRLEREVANSKAQFNAQGLYPTAFATPYGDYNDKVLSAIAKYYTSHRGFADTGYNTWPYSNYLLRVQQVQYPVSVETVKGYIDQAAADGTWLILVFHEVKDVPSTDIDDYQYATSDLDAIAAYAKQIGLRGTNITEGLVAGEPEDNLLTDPVNGGSIGNGWTADVPGNVAVDTGSNGSSPESTTSVKVTSSPTSNVHLFSPTVSVNDGAEYVVKGYVAMSTTKLGTVGFYIDEYDTNGNWVSGQYKQTIYSWYLRDISFSYFPSSENVSSASLQIILSASNGSIIYVDSVQWLAVVAGTPPPPPPTPDPEPQPDPEPADNLLTNGSFENGFTGWTTDNSSVISLDTTGNGHGSEATNSVKLSNSSESNSQLFSEKVSVIAGTNYSISAYLNMVSFAQDIGFYVDEYDVNGNWISGQYLATKRDETSGKISLNYTPTSTNVASASLQVIMVSGSGTIAYIDDVQWVTA